MCLVLAGAAEAAPPPAPQPAAPVLHVGPTRALQRIAMAAQQAVDGSVIEVDAGDYAGDVAVWDLPRVTIRGVGGPVRLIAAGAHAEGKAIWVIRRGEVTVENIEFIGARVRDRNGAGIRLEGGRLTVRRCRFLDSENGILTGNDPTASLDVEESEFGHLGAGDGRSHGLYVGSIGSFRLSGSHVHHANVGHLVKSRARFSRIEYNRLADGDGGRASYELEFPNGGMAEVVGNVIQQGPGTENRVLVSFGAEGYGWPRNDLVMTHNTLVNGAGWPGRFVRVAAGAGAVSLRNNLWVGLGDLDAGAGADLAGNRAVSIADLVSSATGDFRLTRLAHARLREDPLAPLAPGTTPHAEYVHPSKPSLLQSVPSVAGALQSKP